MAEDDGETAFFQAQSMNTEYMGYDEDGRQGADISDSDDYDPSKTLQDQYSAPLTYSKPDLQTPASLSVSPAPRSANEASVSQEVDQTQQPTDKYPSQTPSSAESSASASVPLSNVYVHPKTRTVGGFVIEDDDEDNKGETEYEPPAVLGGEEGVGSVSTSMPEHPISENANETVSSSGVSIQPPAPDMASSKDVSNSSYSPTAPVASQNDASFIPGERLYSVQASHVGNITDSPAPTPPNNVASTSRGRLPHDRVGILEDRIKEDPRGDTTAWLELISEHRSRNRIDSTREAYERFLKIFPSAAEQWVAYANMESENNELYRLEQIFNRTLLTIPNVHLWSVYLDYVRRRNPETTDPNGQARRIISSAYDLAIQNMGMDKDSASIWTDYIEFLRSGPGNIGGSNWQDQQKMDILRKAYQKAICVPTHAVNMLWKEYDQFEMGLNKLTGRKFVQERSPAYMTARSSYTELQNITRDLNRTTLPRLPPLPGSDGDDEFNQQADIWRRWINWEKSDPLVLKEEDLAGYTARVLYVYKQSLMALRFVPEIWFEAADFCFQHDMESEGNGFLKQGIEANPESCLLAFKRADRLEITTESEQDAKKRGTKVREHYDKLLDALYDLIAKARARESRDVARIEENFLSMQVDDRHVQEDDDEEERGSEEKVRDSEKKKQIDAIRNAHAIQISMLSKTISFAWIALMRAMRRIQGKGKPGEMAGSRQVFADARKRGRITSDVYIASALIEYHCYKDPAATKIFERGAKLFPEDENFALEYLKHLIDINDVTNARAVFEMTVRKLASNPDSVPKAKPIFAFLHDYESRYGDLVQIINLETRMRELFPDDPTLSQFSHRYSTPTFDPTAVKPLISPSQARSKLSSSDQALSVRDTPTPRYPDIPSTNSPKRPFPLDEFDDELSRPRKFIRADSPLKGNAGRRLDLQKRTQQVNGGVHTGGQFRPQASATPLPRDIVYLLSIIPPASAYNVGRFVPEKIIELIRRVDIPSSISQLRPPPQPVHNIGIPIAGIQPYTSGYPPGP